MASDQLLLRNYRSEDAHNKPGNLAQQFQERINGIDEEMKKIDSTLGEFLDAVSTDFNGVVGKIDTMQKNMTKVKKERDEAEKELISFKE